MQLQGREAHHLLEVLRAKPGDTLTVFDGRGQEGRAQVAVAQNGQVELHLQQQWPASLEPPISITVYLPLLKGDKLADVVRAATELGASQLVLVATQHAVAKDMGAAKLDRLRRICIEAAKQCQRTVVPLLSGPIDLREVPPVDQGLVAHPNSSVKVAQSFNPEQAVSLITGPEGGLSTTEIDSLQAKGFRAVTLGPRILRAETAAVALLSLVTAAEAI